MTRRFIDMFRPLLVLRPEKTLFFICKRKAEVYIKLPGYLSFTLKEKNAMPVVRSD